MSQTSESKPEIRLDFYALIPHPTDPKLLLLAGEAGWSLPHWASSEALWWPMVAALNRGMQEQLNAELTTLCCVYAERQSTGQGERIFWMENHTPDWPLPTGGRWIGREELGG